MKCPINQGHDCIRNHTGWYYACPTFRKIFETWTTSAPYVSKQPDWYLSHHHRDDHLFHPRFFDQSIIDWYLLIPTTVRSFISRCLDNHYLPEVNAPTVYFPNRLSLLDCRPRSAELFWLLCFLPCTIKNADRQYFSTISYKSIFYHHYFNIFLRQSGRLAPVASNGYWFLWSGLYL